MKIQIIFILITCLLFINTGFFSVFANDIETKDDEITVYSVSKDVFRKFISNPSMEILQSDNNEVSVFKKSAAMDGYIKREIVTRNPVQVDEARSGVMRLQYHLNFPIYTEFIDFINDEKNFQNIFSNYNLNCNIETYAIVEGEFPSSVNMPVIVWVATEKENYFITINEKPNLNNPNSTEFCYILYSQSLFVEKFGLYDGTLQVNGEDITSDDKYIKFEHNGVYLPFRAIMESLGATVNWIAEQDIILLTCGNEEYVLETKNNYSLVKAGTSFNLLMPPPGGSYYCAMIDDRIIMDRNTMQVFTNLMNATINVNYDERIVNINKK